MTITLDDLLKRPVSFSSLKEFAKSPKHYIDYINKPRESSKAMMLGSLVHCLVLEPHLFKDKYSVIPNVDRRTADGKKQYNEALEDAMQNKKELITKDEEENANNIVSVALQDSKVKKVVEDCLSYELEWHADCEGIPVRGFVDGLAEKYILEVKTINDANPKTIINDFFNRGYHIQAGAYNYAFGVPIKYLIIETSSPYNYYIADADADYVSFGKKKFESLMAEFKHCLDNNLWHMGYEYYTGDNNAITLPAWAK